MFRVPLATYRLQFNASFTFDDARRIAGYLAALGITDIYASPILKARKGSVHGYDVIDASAINPELGSEEDFNALHEELKQHKLGFLMDTVPNHMAASAENSWWVSVLENGPHSRFVHYFDIDMRPITIQGRTVDKLLLPILGKPYGETIEAQEIKLGFDADGFFFTYYDKRLPVAPQTYSMIVRKCLEALPPEGVAVELRDLVDADTTAPNSKFLKETLWRIYEQYADFRRALNQTIENYNGVLGDAASFNDLDSLLDSQWYRLAYWRLASEKINYRRFFDVTDLVGVRVENPEVFEARSRRALELSAEGKVTGLRIDHIDGLYDPVSYMRKLQLRLQDPGAGAGSSDARSFYIVVEKILARDEVLPSDFPVSGTTGYDYLDTLNAVFVDPSGLTQLDKFAKSFTGATESFDDLCYERKKQVIHELFAGEMRALGKQLAELSLDDRNARDFSPVELLSGLTEITACMKVYRTYMRDVSPSDTDRQRIRDAVACARERSAESIDDRLFAFLERVLLIDPPSYLQTEKERWLAFVMRWQQFTGRVMAKGVEDTAFYNYHRLVSLNEVGGEPGRHTDFDPVAEFHARNERIVRDWPDTMNATSTHDTKRSQDVRARINVLSEISDGWTQAVRAWSKMNAPLRRDGVPHPNEELLLYQTLIGMWPVDEEEVPTVRERLRQYQEKAAREAKTHTSWITPNAEYEKALLDYGDAILDSEEFHNAFHPLQRRIAFHGFLNSLSQVVLKITSPGVPDFYQGTELWDFSLVDPDNRRPVDYDRRIATLKKLETADGRGALDVSTMLKEWVDGRIKMFAAWRALQVRGRNEEVFRRGSYQALPVDSPNVCAFVRGESVIVAVPRLTTRLVQPGTLPLGAIWKDLALNVAPASAGEAWKNAFTGETIEGHSLPLSKVFATFPAAILERV